MIMAITTGKLAAGSAGTIVAVIGAVETDKWLAMAGAFVSVGSVLIPTLIEWYHKSKAAERQEFENDMAIKSRLFALEVKRRAELEVKIKDLEAKFEHEKCPFAEEGKARCEPQSPHPSEQ